jgi:hypothetical protein
MTQMGKVVLAVFILLLQVTLYAQPQKQPIIKGNFAVVNMNTPALIKSITNDTIKRLAQQNKIVIESIDLPRNRHLKDFIKPKNVIKPPDTRVQFQNSLQLITDSLLPPLNRPVFMVLNPFERGKLVPREQWNYLTFLGDNRYGEFIDQDFLSVYSICFTEPVIIRRIVGNNYEISFPALSKGTQPYATYFRQKMAGGGPAVIRVKLLPLDWGRKGFLLIYANDSKYIDAAHHAGFCPLPSFDAYNRFGFRHSTQIQGGCNFLYTSNLSENPSFRRLDSARSFFRYQIFNNERVRNSTIYFASSNAPWPAACTNNQMDQDGDSFLGTAYGGSDCDDNNAFIYPYRLRSGGTYNDECDIKGLDTDCVPDIELYFRDEDNDGYYSSECFEISLNYSFYGRVIRGTDCDDHNPSIIPGRVMYIDETTYYICGNYDSEGKRIDLRVETGYRCVRQPDGTALILPR